MLGTELEQLTAEAQDIEHRIERATKWSTLGARKVNLIKLLWESGEREQLRRVLDVLLEKVVVRLDEVLIYMSVPPVRGNRQKSALNHVFRIPFKAGKAA